MFVECHVLGPLPGKLVCGARPLPVVGRFLVGVVVGRCLVVVGLDRSECGVWCLVCRQGQSVLQCCLLVSVVCAVYVLCWMTVRWSCPWVGIGTKRLGQRHVGRHRWVPV